MSLPGTYTHKQLWLGCLHIMSSQPMWVPCVQTRHILLSVTGSIGQGHNNAPLQPWIKHDTKQQDANGSLLMHCHTALSMRPTWTCRQGCLLDPTRHRSISTQHHHQLALTVCLLGVPPCSSPPGHHHAFGLHCIWRQG